MDSVKTATIAEIIKDGLYCPRCRQHGKKNKMIAMSKPGGLRCSHPGNRWDGKKWSMCPFVIWLEAPEDGEEGNYLLRPSTFPTIPSPTKEQQAIRRWFSLSPSAKGGRLGIANAGPGTGKTTTVAWSAQALWERLGSLERAYFCAFNRNARTVLLQKLPWEASDIFTLNGLGGRFQGYRGGQYNDAKLYELWNELTLPIEEEERPEFYGMDELIDRMRAQCLFNPRPDDRAWWDKAIEATIARFGLSDSKMGADEERKMREVYSTWVPILTTQAHARKDQIDLGEQWCRAVNEAIAKTGYRLPWECCELTHVWTDEQVRAFAEMVRRIELVNCYPRFIAIDEAQDLSLAQLAFYLAAALKNSNCEIFFIGDDANGLTSDKDYKAGQGIYGWRGAFPGIMKLLVRLWKVLTGEDAAMLPLTETHRCAPEIVDAFRPLYKVLKSSRKPGQGVAMKAPHQTAMGLWLELPEPATALWITRTNRESGKILMDTLKARVPCSFRGGTGFKTRIDALFYKTTEKRRDKNGEYGMPLDKFCEKLEAIIYEKTGGEEQKAADLLETLVVAIGREVLRDDEALKTVSTLPHFRPTVGNVRRLLLLLADKDARRCVTNVYRVKGDEADWAFVSDIRQFNSPWGGNHAEMMAVQLVALSRGRDGLVVTGDLIGLSEDIRVVGE